MRRGDSSPTEESPRRLCAWHGQQLGGERPLRARKSLNAQILCMGCNVMAFESMKKVVDAFIDEPFDWARESSVINLKLMEEAQYKRAPKPENITWSMGFYPDDAQRQA